MGVFIPRFLGALAYLLGLTVIGVVGYTAIEGWRVAEALYMTVITITAVGYSEVYPLSELGRSFTMVLLAAGITGIGVWFASSPRSSSSSISQTSEGDGGARAC